MADKDRTKREIVSALSSLSAEVPFEKVTVTQICERAQLSRQTFYQHFQDKYAVANWFVQTLLQDNFKVLGTKMGWRTAYLRTFEQSERFLPLMKYLGQSDDYNSVRHATVRDSQADFTNCYLKRYGETPGELITFQIKHFAFIATEAHAQWINAGCRPSAEHFTDLFLTLIPRELFCALDVPETELPSCQQT